MQMGLIQAGIGAAKGVLEDQWRDYFYCESLQANVLVTKGMKKNPKRSLFKNNDNNIISNGSIIAINEGQAMAIVDQGKIIEFCAEPGEFLFDTSTEASIFYGPLSENIKESFKNFGKRFTFGGEAPKDIRIYYFNTKEIPGNKYGTPAPVPFRVVDQNIGLDIDIAIRTNGEYSYKIVDPILFYTNVTGNVASTYERDQIEGQLRTELLTALQPAFAKISAMGIRYSALPGHTTDLANALNEVLSEQWTKIRGIKIVSFGVNTVNASEQDEKMIKELQRNAVFRNTGMAAAHLTGAQADAMILAAGNDGGAMTGFFGMNMATNAGGVDATQLFEMSAQRQAEANKQANVQSMQATKWTCSCGTQNNGKFCAQCGTAEPQNDSWTCACGKPNSGKFCAECGTAKPVTKGITCDKCGWQPTIQTSPKFCPECGDPITEADHT
jgi:membrane protease subunit (stomatin/prohibitin family)